MINSVGNITLDPEINKKLMEVALARAVSSGKVRGSISAIMEEALSIYLDGMVTCSQCGYLFYSPPDALLDKCPNCGHIKHVKHSNI